MSETDIEDRMTERGHQTWHSSEDGGGPDVGVTVGLGDGRMLWVGEISKSKHSETPAAHHLGDDFGWWLILYGKTTSQVVGKCVDAEAARDMMDVLTGAFAKAQKTRT